MLGAASIVSSPPLLLSLSLSLSLSLPFRDTNRARARDDEQPEREDPESRSSEILRATEDTVRPSKSRRDLDNDARWRH